MVHIGAMNCKHSTLSISTVSTCAVALLLGHLFVLPSDPLSQASTSWPVHEDPQVVGTIEVPSRDAGRVLEREPVAIVQAGEQSAQLPSAAVPQIRDSAQELRAVWANRMPHSSTRSVVQKASDLPLLGLLIVLAAVGLVVCKADVNDMMEEEQKKEQEEVVKEAIRTSPASSLWVMVPLIVACFAFAGAALFCPVAHQTATLPAAPVPQAELQTLIQSHAYRLGSIGDHPLAAALAVWALLGLWVSQADVEEMTHQMQEKSQPHVKLPAAPPAAGQEHCCGFSRGLCAVGFCRILLPVAALVVAAASVAALPWLRGVGMATAATSVSIADTELRMAIGGVAGCFHRALPEQAVIAALTIFGLLGTAAARSDFQEEADRCKSLNEHELRTVFKAWASGTVRKIEKPAE